MAHADGSSMVRRAEKATCLLWNIRMELRFSTLPIHAEVEWASSLPLPIVTVVRP
jgi:hypothetical protein